MKLSTVNVVSTSTNTGTVNFVRSYTDDDEGNKEAEKQFRKKAKAFGCLEEDMDDAIENGYYEGIEDSIWLVHSMN